MSDRDRVHEGMARRMAASIGVEMQRSRSRTPSADGYGLWRVRGSWREMEPCPGAVDGGPAWVPIVRVGKWTGYMFTWQAVWDAASRAIRLGVPDRPGAMTVQLVPAAEVPDEATWPEVPTRWTSEYRGSRVLGLGGEAEAVAVLAGAGLDPRPTDAEGLDVALLRYDPEVRANFAPETTTALSADQRRRAANREFQAAHKPRRDAGLTARHAAKLSRGEQREP
jgi:hypothetical protein